MALPTSTIWNIADFSGSALGTMLTLGSSDLSIIDSDPGSLAYEDGVVRALSAAGSRTELRFTAAVSSRFTVELTARFPRMPRNTADLANAQAGLVVASSTGRGLATYFATSGVAISRVDDFGSVTALPDTSDLTAEVASQFSTIRIAVDAALGRAYVYTGSGDSVSPEIRYIIPVEPTPAGVSDTFKLVVHGQSDQPVELELRALRLASSLLIPNFPPIADAGPDRVAVSGQALRLDGRASFDIEGAAISYQWRATDAPYGSEYAFEGTSCSATDDEDGDETTNLVEVLSEMPEEVAAGDILVVSSSRYEIQEVLETGFLLASDALPVSLTEAPFRVISQAVLVDDQSATPTVVPDVPGIYRFQLVVNDGESDSEPSEVLANVVNSRAPLGIEPDVSTIWQAVGDEWRLVENRQVFEEAWRGAAQILAGKLLELWQHHYNYSIRDAQKVFQRKWVAYRTFTAEESHEDVTYASYGGPLVATWAFEDGMPDLEGKVLTLTRSTGIDTEISVDIEFDGTESSIQDVIDKITDTAFSSGFYALSSGIRDTSSTYLYTASDGEFGENLAQLNFTPDSLPSWVSVGDAITIGETGDPYAVRAAITQVDNSAGWVRVDNAAMYARSDLVFRIFRGCRLRVFSTPRFLASGTAATVLGFPSDPSVMSGSGGSRITDRTYFAGDGVSLPEDSDLSGFLLVLNSGQSFVIDRALTSQEDPLAYQRLLLQDVLPFDASATWNIPDLVTSTVDYERAGVYPGDLVKIELYDTVEETTHDVGGVVIGQRAGKLAVQLDDAVCYVLMLRLFEDPAGDRYELRMLGVRRRRAIPIQDDVISIPRLQDYIPQSANPTILRENVHYILEPFYREQDGSAIPMLQFVADLPGYDEPPDILWAELVISSNDQNIEDLFGRIVGFTRDHASTLPSDFSYVAGVAGLMYASQQPATAAALRIGAQVLLGQPFAEAAGTIEEINTDFSPLRGRLLVRDASGTPDAPSEIIRTYYYKKDPSDLSSTSGLDLNPDTGVPWAVGDEIGQFMPIGSGISLVDMYDSPDWYRPYVRSGIITELEKFHTFMVRFDLDLVSITNLSLLKAFLLKMRPKSAHPLVVGVQESADDLDPLDDNRDVISLRLYDSTDPLGRAFMHDDYRGDGTLWSNHDDGFTYYDGLTDRPEDYIEFFITIDWPGGDFEVDDTLLGDLVDVDGNVTTPGGTFTATYGMSLPAGTYEKTAVIKSGGLVIT